MKNNLDHIIYLIEEYQRSESEIVGKALVHEFNMQAVVLDIVLSKKQKQKEQKQIAVCK